MKKVYIILKHELKLNFYKPFFYLFMGLASLIMSLNFLKLLSQFSIKSTMASSQSPESMGPLLNIHYQVFFSHVSTVHLLLLFFLPALTMRSLAEEKQNKTLSLLQTSPISSMQIVVAKILSNFISVVFILAVSLIYPLVTLVLTDFLLLPLVLAYFGLILISSVYVSSGVFISSLFSSPYMSVLFSLIFNVLFISVLTQLPNLFEDPNLNSFFVYLSPGQHLNQFLKGILDLSSLYYFLTLVVIMILLTVQNLEFFKQRGSNT